MHGVVDAPRCSPSVSVDAKVKVAATARPQPAAVEVADAPPPPVSESDAKTSATATAPPTTAAHVCVGSRAPRQRPRMAQHSGADAQMTNTLAAVVRAIASVKHT